VSITTLSDRTLAHQVRLLHDSTGRPLTPTNPFLIPRLHGWTLRIVEGRVVVVVPTGLTPPAVPPLLDVLIADAVVADLLSLPPSAPDQRPRSVRVPLTAGTVDVVLKPVAMTLAVVLTRPDGAPSTGRTVKASGASGPDIPLVETATAGTYESVAVVWDHRYTPAELVIDGTLLDHKVAVDLRSAKTRLHVVDTT
jgi:hypothetical protein